MDIRVANTYNAYSVYNVKNTPGAKKTDRTGKAESFKDTFSLSTQAEDYQTVRKALAGVPDVRTDKINQIKAKIDANAYHVSSGDVAASILQDLED